MDAAVKNTVAGIAADCGGAYACATCHVMVDPSRLSMLTPPLEREQSMLECAEEIKENSRLSCQILVTEALDGLSSSACLRGIFRDGFNRTLLSLS